MVQNNASFFISLLLYFFYLYFFFFTAPFPLPCISPFLTIPIFFHLLIDFYFFISSLSLTVYSSYDMIICSPFFFLSDIFTFLIHFCMNTHLFYCLIHFILTCLSNITSLLSLLFSPPALFCFSQLLLRLHFFSSFPCPCLAFFHSSVIFSPLFNSLSRVQRSRMWRRVGLWT